MKKKNLLIVSAVIVIGIIIGSLFYPPVDNSNVVGTIGKAEKYRNKKTEQEIIVLRNEFLKDTTELKAAINALDSYGLFLSSMQNDLTEWETSLIKARIKDQKFAKQVLELKQIAAFMENNLKTVGETRELLYKYYTKDTLNMSIDIQNNLIQFDGFIANLDEKSKTIDSLFLDLTDMIENNRLEKLTSAKEEIETLKEVREKMLGTMIFFAYTTGNEARLNLALCSNVMNFAILNKQLNNKVGLMQKLGMIEIGSRGKLGTLSQDLNSKQVGAKDQLGTGFTAKDELGLKARKDQLGLLGKDVLCSFFSREAMAFVASSNKEQLGTIDAKLNSAVYNKPLSSLLDSKNLGLVNNGNNFAFAQQLGLAAQGAYVIVFSGLQNSANWAWAAQNSLRFYYYN